MTLSCSNAGSFVEKRTLNRRIKRTFYRGALPFDKIGLKVLFNRFGAESPKKALVLLLKEQEMNWSLNRS